MGTLTGAGEVAAVAGGETATTATAGVTGCKGADWQAANKLAAANSSIRRRDKKAVGGLLIIAGF